MTRVLCGSFRLFYLISNKLTLWRHLNTGTDVNDLREKWRSANINKEVEVKFIEAGDVN